MKKIAILFIVFILIFTSIIHVQAQANPRNIFKSKKLIDLIEKQKVKSLNSDLPNSLSFDPEDIELKDDAFHGADLFNYAEWWYFDAIFENNLSAQITFYIFSAMTQKFIVVGVTVYKDGFGVFGNEKYYIFNDLDMSREIPYIQIDGNQLMKGYIDETSGKWIYDITIDFIDSSIDLQFIGLSKGWMGDLAIGGWAVVLPKAEVLGKINLNGLEYNVKGIGYHDHNWGMNLFDLLHFGWYWGRIHSDNLTIVWFVIQNTRFDSESLCVISRENDYINIDPKVIDFQAKDFSLDIFWWIPNSFTLKVNTNEIYLTLLMDAASIDSDYKINGHYCRYHLNCVGNIVINNQLVDLSGINLAEFNRFR
jgi:hypothetical protein